MQFGSQIRPELGRTDYTAFLQGANQGSAAIGQGIAGLGQGIAQGIQQYQQNKMLAGQGTAKWEAFVQNNPEILQAATSPNAPKDIARAVNKLQKDGTVGARDAAMLASFGEMFVNQKEAAAAKQRAQDDRLQMQVAGSLMAAGAQNPLPAMAKMGLRPNASVVQFVNEQNNMRAETAKRLAEANALGFPKQQDLSFQEQAVAAAINDYQAQHGRPPQGGELFGIYQTVAQMSKPTTNINMGQDQYAATLGKSVADQHLDLYNKARKSVADLEKLDETIGLIQTGDLNTGILADLKTDIDRISSGFLADKKAGKRVADTQILEAMLGSDVFSMISSLGIGARGLDTPAEREFLRDVMTGSKKLDRDSLERLTKIRRKITANAIKAYNKEVQSGRMKKFFEVSGFSPEPIPVPMEPDELIDSALKEIRKGK